MRFPVRKRRQTPAVIIIALIDVLIVMLIFLMATTTFRQHPALKLALPESTQARTGASEKALLVISVDLLGDLRLGSDPKPITPDDLRHALEIETLKNPDVRLAIRADEDAPFGRIVKVMDAAKAANVKTVSAYTRKVGQP